MAECVQSFDELRPHQRVQAGGKGGTLSALRQAGYPVPDGFVILPHAFTGDTLDDRAWTEVRARLAALRAAHHATTSNLAFAVRSSALAEDSAQTSFAGEFETVLDVRTDDAIRAAIQTVFSSRTAPRVQAYSAAHGVDPAHPLAVVVQIMVQSEMAGVLFTADPVSGSYAAMVGNYVHGLGEQLVAGEVNAHAFQLARPKGRYTGPQELRRYAAKLHRLAARLEKELDGPQDIEWAIANGNLYILQARPITTLSPGNLDTYEINESLVEEALWVNTNVSEAVPDVFSPLTWSLVRGFDHELNFIPGYYVWSGNICGRVYSNISRRVSAIAVILGWDGKRVMRILGEMFGEIPEEMEVPIFPATRMQLLRAMLPRIAHLIVSMLKASRQLPRFLAETPAWCKDMTARLHAARTNHELLTLWQNELQPYCIKAWWSHAVGGSGGVVNIMKLNKKLTELVSKQDANALLSNLRGGAELASLGPVLGLSRVVKGEMSRAEYLERYGHRGPHEFELSIPHPAEDPDWLAQQIEEIQKSHTDVESLLQQQEAQHEAARTRFCAEYPRKAKWLDKQLAQASAGARKREMARSEFVRVFRVARAFALRAGELTGLGEDVFFLYIHELEALLAGDAAARRHIPARKANYAKYKVLPPFPSVIRGRFNPNEWASDPHRRHDYFDPTLAPAAPDAATLTGIAGAAGRIEGRVRVLRTPEEGHLLRAGEILVTTTTNVGWTPLFLKAAAVVTDIGAPLSHAAIVARELGIPAVVGCGNATTRLKTGDTVIVDGGQGLVHLA